MTQPPQEREQQQQPCKQTEGHVANHALHNGSLGLRVFVNSRVSKQVLQLRDLSLLVVDEQPATSR